MKIKHLKDKKFPLVKVIWKVIGDVTLTEKIKEKYLYMFYSIKNSIIKFAKFL